MKSTLSLLIIGLIIGLLITAQFKTPRQRILNPVEPFSSLSSTREDLIAKVTVLKDALKSRRSENDALQTQLKQNKKSAEGLVEQFNELKQKVGLTELVSRGVVVSLADSSLAGELSIDSIVHAADLRDIVNTLWNAGAQAISINDERMVANTSIDSIVNIVLVNNTRITSPFVVKAVGDPKILAESVESTNNLNDLYRRKKNFGVILNVEKAKEVTIPAFTGSFDINFAKVQL